MEILGQLQHFSALQKTKRQLPPLLEGAQGTWPSANTTGIHVLGHSLKHGRTSLTLLQEIAHLCSG